jgi:hypothetical protein
MYGLVVIKPAPAVGNAIADAGDMWLLKVKPVI